MTDEQMARIREIHERWDDKKQIAAETNLTVHLTKEDSDSPDANNAALDERPLPLSEKFLLTIREAMFYFNIGEKRMRRLAEENLGVFAVFSGNRYLIIRPKFEEFVLNSTEI